MRDHAQHISRRRFRTLEKIIGILKKEDITEKEQLFHIRNVIAAYKKREREDVIHQGRA